MFFVLFLNCVLGNEAICSIMSQVGVKGGVVDSQASGVLIIFIYATNSIRVIFFCSLFYSPLFLNFVSGNESLGPIKSQVNFSTVS